MSASPTAVATEPELLPRAAEPREPKFALIVAMLGFFVVAQDAQVVNVALPDIRAEFGRRPCRAAVGGHRLHPDVLRLLLFAGTLADRTGARRTYGVGLALFVAASAACGLAPALPVLVVARLVQGVGAALVAPTSLALVRTAYHDSAGRANAIALWAMGGSAAAAAGPLLGGALTQLDWRLIFFLNLPVGAVAFVVLARVQRSARRAVPFDWTGQIASVLALAALTFAVIEGAGYSYGSPAILAAFAITAVAGVVFLVAQARGRPSSTR